MDPRRRSLVEEIARLARLELDADEVDRIGEQFDRILVAFEGLSELDTDGLEPMTGPCELEDVVRADVPQDGFEARDALANAPEPIDGFFGVPKTLGGDA